MDVQCERCKAEYEFDDALVSARGTTVKCTSCGHQFKIRREGATDDRWSVRTVEGRDLVFTSLRELQKAILARQVSRPDTLVRGNGPPRALGAISELEPFFEEAQQKALSQGSGASQRPRMPSQPPGGRPGATTQIGHAFATAATMPKRQSSRPPAPAPPAPSGRPPPALRPIMTPTPPPSPLKSADAMRPKIDTLRPPASVPAPAPLPETLPRPVGELTDDSHAGKPPVPAVSVAPVLSAGEPGPPSSREEIEPEPPSAEPPTEQRPRTHSSAPFMLAAQPATAPKATMIGTGPSAPPKTTMIGTGASAPPPAARTAISSPPQATSNRPPPPTISPRDIETSSPLPAPTVPVRHMDDAFRSAMSSVDEESGELRLPGRPRRVGGWVVALVLLLGAGVLGLAVAKPYLAARDAAKAAPPIDPRAQQMLDDGERAMTAGDLEAANDDFTKASALAEKEPRVLVDVARLAAARADVPWLRLKLLPDDAADDKKMAKAQLDELGARAKNAADAAAGAGPDQPSAILAKIDALRITGDGAAGRALVSKVIAQASQPETAYVLAALDLAEPEPLWPMVIERLRLAAAGEGNEGRARAALVYALARSGDPAGAKGELEKLAGLARPYPLVGVLRAFVAKVPATAAIDAGSKKAAASGTATVDVASLPKSGKAGAGGGGGGGGGPASDFGSAAPSGGGGRGGFKGASDPRVLLQQAESAKQSHDLDRARALYSAALAQNANDSEALAGLGDVAHAQKDVQQAASYYHRALGVNPVYLPALVGLGDVEWESGDKDTAQKTYRDIVDRFPEGTYPARVKSRANGSVASPPTGTTDTSASDNAGGTSP